MGSVTCRGGWSVLPVPGGCAAAGGGRSGAAGVLDSATRSEEVPGVTRKVRSYPEASLHPLDRKSIFWVVYWFF